jgi:hypothetical protein
MIRIISFSASEVPMALPTHVANEIARLMRDPDALRHERERMPPSGRRGHYDPNQPRVPGGHSDGGQWTAGGRGTAPNQSDGDPLWLARFPSPDTHPMPTPVRPGPPTIRPLVRPGPPIITLLALFATLSAENSPEQRAIFEFNARRFRKDGFGALDGANVDILNREQVENECKKLDKVQRKTDKAVDNVNNRNASTGVYMSPSQFGTAVHKDLKDQIVSLNNPNFGRKSLTGK